MPLQRHNTYYDSTNPTSGVYYYDELGNLLPLTIDKICHPGVGITFSANTINASGSGEGTAMNLKEGPGIQITHETGTTNYTIGVSADYALKSELPDLNYYYKKSETSGANEIANALGNKLDKPDITQPELNEKYLVYSTLSGQGQPKGWTDILDKVYSKSETDKTFIKKNLDDTLSGGSGENKLGLNTANIDSNKQYAWTTEGWKEVAAQSNLSAGTDLKIVDSIVQVNTNGIANSAGFAFVEGINTVASGIASHAEGRANSAYSDYSHIEGYRNSDYKAGTKLEANHTEGAYNQTSGVYAHVEGHANKLYGYGVHMQGGYNEFTIHNTSADRTDPDGRWNIWGISIEGMANATTAEPTSGTREESDFGYVHGGILKVIGNGTRTKESEDPSSETITRSDALILYRDGSMMVKGPISANGVELGNYTPTLPLNIGNNNTVTNDSIGVIGNNSYAGVKSMAISYTGATAISNSMAFGDGNYASANSMAAGWGVKAKDYSVIFGHGTTNEPSEVKNYSFAVGDAVFAYNYSQAFGRGLIASGNPNGKGCMVIGGWNKTSADALFVIGNGTNSDAAHRNDLLVAYANGSIVVGNGNNVTQSNSYVEGLNHTVTPVGATSYGHGYNHIEGAYNTANGGLYNHIEGEANVVYGDRVHMEGSRNIFSAGEGGNTWGISIEGALNSTTANVTEHGGLLKVIGNGVYTDNTHQTRSDASILYRDGTWKATDYETFTGNNKLSEKVSTTDSPHGSNLKAELAVITFSDNEIISFVENGGCSGKGTLIFRVG